MGGWKKLFFGLAGKLVINVVKQNAVFLTELANRQTNFRLRQRSAETTRGTAGISSRIPAESILRGRVCGGQRNRNG
jgi:CRISPR/Cas system CMR subunit Cmr4 (Cas7 group RAMP superfamily)